PRGPGRAAGPTRVRSVRLRKAAPRPVPPAYGTAHSLLVLGRRRLNRLWGGGSVKVNGGRIGDSGHRVCAGPCRGAPGSAAPAGAPAAPGAGRGRDHQVLGAGGCGGPAALPWGGPAGPSVARLRAGGGALGGRGTVGRGLGVAGPRTRDVACAHRGRQGDVRPPYRYRLPGPRRPLPRR